MENLIEQVDTQTDSIQDKYLTFLSNHQYFGVPISQVVQIVGLQKIIRIPNFPDYAKGIINIRGQTIPVVDIRTRFNMPAIEYDERTCVIITGSANHHTGFIVDGVDEVANIIRNDISPPPAIGSLLGNNQYITGIGKQENKNILLLDLQKVVSARELQLS